MITQATQYRINLFDIKDYINIRKENKFSNVTWENVKHLNLPNGRTFWQMLASIEDYDERYEPSMEQLLKIGNELGLD